MAASRLAYMTNTKPRLAKITALQVVGACLILAVAVVAIWNFHHRESMGGGARGRLDLADRTGWKRVDTKPPVLLLVNEQQSMLSAFPFAQEPSEADMRRLLKTNRMELGTGSPRPLSGSVQGVDTRGWMRSFVCADDGWMVVTYVELGKGEASNRDTVAQARCLPRDAPDIAWPRSSITLPGG
jgi:hypothetical protein